MSIIDRLNAILGSEEHGAVNTENTPDINSAVSNVGTPQTEDKPITESITNNIVSPEPIPAEAEKATPPSKEVVAGTEEVSQPTIIEETIQDPAQDTVIVQTPEGDVSVVETPEEVVVPPVVETPADVVVETPVAAVEDIAEEVVTVDDIPTVVADPSVPDIVDPPIDTNIVEVVEDAPIQASVETASPDDVVMVHPIDHATAVAAVAASKEAAIAQAQMEAQESAIEAQYYEADNDLQTASTIVESQAAIIDQTQSDIEKLEERIEDMEINFSGLENMLNGTNPWNPELAKVYYDNCSRISSRTFGTESITSIKGMESFSDKDTAKLEILAGAEAMEKRAGKMAEGVKQFFIKMFNTAIDFVEGIYNSAKSLASKADVLVEALNKAPDDRIKDTIKLGAWNSYTNIEKGDGIDHLAKVRKTLSSIGDALKNQNPSTIVDSINKALKDLVGSTTANGKFAVGSTNLGGITFKAKILNSSGENSNHDGLSQVGVQFSKNSEVSTSGEHKTGYGKSKLLDLAKATKSEADKIKDSKFTAASLKAARDKAVAAFESAGGDSEKGNGKVIKAADSVAINISRTLFNYQVKVIAAQQEMVYAHIKK